MALVFPSTLQDILKDPKFIAENTVYKALIDTLPSDAKIYCQCHFFKTGLENNKNDGECDMIILLPNHGVIFLEIKGGIIGYDAQKQEWTSTRRDTKQTFKISNPIAQSLSAKHNIFNLFKDQFAEHKGKFFNLIHAVCFPNTPKPRDPKPFGPDKPLEIFLFQDDLPVLRASLETMLNWSKGDKEIYRIGPPIIKNFDQIIIGNDLPIQLKLKQQLDHERELMTFSSTQTVYINIMKQLNYVALSGGAGTGKTLMAIDLIRQLSKDKRTLFLCYNRALARHVRYSLKEIPNQKNLTILNNFAWINQLSRELKLPRSDIEIDIRLEEVISLAQKKIVKYDMIIVDEGQDFSDEWFIYIESMLSEKGKFFVFYDQRQSIFNKNSQYYLNEKFQKLILNENFRNTKSIFSQFQFLSKIDNFESLGPVGPEPEFIIVKNYEQQFRWIADKIKSLINNQDIELRDTGVVLYDGLKETNIRNLSKIIPKITGYQHTNAEYVEPNQIMMDTINRVKGLEVPVMFLTNFIHPLSKDRLYVSLSRAKHRLYIVGIESKILEIKSLINENTKS